MESNSFEAQVSLELKHFRSSLGKARLNQAIATLARPSAIKSAFHLALEYAMIAVAAYLVIGISYFFIPISLVLLGSRQRALVVLVHEGSHRNLFGAQRVNDSLTKWLCAIPMFISLDTYREVHGEHHRFLGDPEHDSDYLHNPDLIKKGWVKVYFSELFSLESWLGNTFGYPLKWKAGRVYLAWWSLITIVALCVASVESITTFVILWFAARASVYHAIISFVIISDHVGLVPGGILGFARNHPSGGVLRLIIHPYYNGLHLAHHLLPTVPYHNLKKAHDLLLSEVNYKQAEHCQSYFFGEHSVIFSWCKCNRMEDRS